MNPKLESLQFLGIFGIIQETIKLIYQWRKIFTQITLAFILPNYLLTFANIAISIFFHTKTKPSNITSIFSQTIYYLIFNIVSSIISTIFSIFSTATVIYVVTCVYAARDVSFKHVIAIVPKVWKRLLVTFLTVFIALFAWDFVALFVIFSIALSINGSNHGLSVENYDRAILFIFMIIFVVGTWYLILIWQLSYMVSVLEELCGFKAMAKSKALVKGRMRMVTKVLMLLSLPLGMIQIVFYRLVVDESSSVGIVGKVLLVIIWMLLFSLFLLVILVAKTVLYFVCKSYHREIVDKSSLSNHLYSSLLADYDPLSLKADDHVHIGKLQIV